MCKNGTNRENPVFYIGLSSDYMAFFASAINILQTLVVAIQVQNHRELSSLWPEEGLC